MIARPFITLVKKDLLAEMRQKHTFYGVLLYVGATVFVVYSMNGQPEARVWNALFWLTQLFVSVNSVARSFLQEHPHRFRYYYFVVKPQVFLAAKLTYSVLQMTVMSLATLLLYRLMLGWPLIQSGLYICVALTGSISLSVVFTFLSAIAARAQQNASLMAILGFPLAAPVLMILSKLATVALQPLYMPGWWGLAGVLLGIDILIILLGMILFPVLWHE